MKRNKKILVLASCILNANAKITPLATYGGPNMEFLVPWMEKGVGILQLPCPETGFLGMNRWGMTQEQYDHPAYRSHCRKVLAPALLEIQAFTRAGYTIAGIAGVKGSPSCGYQHTCTGFTGGELGGGHSIQDQLDQVKMVPGRGVFMDVIHHAFQELGLAGDFFEVPDPV